MCNETFNFRLVCFLLPCNQFHHILVLTRVTELEREVLQLGLDIVQPETVCQWRIEIFATL